MSAANDRQSATAMPPSPRFQFNLKFVLAVTAACAVSAAVVPFDWQPFCPLAMAVLVLLSQVVAQRKRFGFKALAVLASVRWIERAHYTTSRDSCKSLGSSGFFRIYALPRTMIAQPER